MNSSNILIIYPYFLPAQKAGGIVSSLSNLTKNLKHIKFFVYTSAFDLDGSVLPIKKDQWQKLYHNTYVYYRLKKDIDFINFASKEKVNSIYINGVFGYTFFLKPLWKLRNWKNLNENKLIIAPRGMIQKGALKVKPLKKKVYFTILKNSNLLKKVWWHATDKQEQIDIQNFFQTFRVILAEDTPTPNPKFNKILKKKKSKYLNAVFLSLITAKKNLIFLLNLINNHPSLKISLDIYGPVKDQNYWKQCKKLIEANSFRVNYKGSISPNQVTSTLAKYDLFLLPTLGENFGHVIFEALTAGTPVLISPYTPWKQLEKFKAGFQIELNYEAWLDKINFFLNMSAETKHSYSMGAQTYIKQYLSKKGYIEQYNNLFFHN